MVWPKEDGGFLLKRLGEDSHRIPGTIIVCCVLHNICVLRGDQLNISVSDGDDSDDDNDDNGTPPPLSEAAAAVLQALVQYPDFVLVTT